jgi:hypothetical protein
VTLQIRRHGSVRRPEAGGLADENRKLKKLLAESMIDNATLKEMLTKNF